MEKIDFKSNKNISDYLLQIKFGIDDVVKGMIRGAVNMTNIAIAIATAGIIVGAVASTGLSNAMIEVVEVIYNKRIISYEKLLDNFWVNIDPFDDYGQFCDKGYSYRSVAFYRNDQEKKLIERDIKNIEKKFNKKVVTYLRKFEKFFKAENNHQNFYKVKFENYLRYKKACKREETLKDIWGIR